MWVDVQRACFSVSIMRGLKSKVGSCLNIHCCGMDVCTSCFYLCQLASVYCLIATHGSADIQPCFGEYNALTASELVSNLSWPPCPYTGMLQKRVKFSPTRMYSQFIGKLGPRGTWELGSWACNRSSGRRPLGACCCPIASEGFQSVLSAYSTCQK